MFVLVFACNVEFGGVLPVSDTLLLTPLALSANLSSILFKLSESWVLLIITLFDYNVDCDEQSLSYVKKVHLY